MKKLSSLTIFFPCYNDEPTIGGLVEKAYTIGPKIAKKLEVMVVNDGSTDGSSEVLKKLKLVYKNLIVITHRKNRGYGGALISGLKKASQEFVFYTDGDAQYDLNQIVLLVNKMEPWVGGVMGYIDRADANLRNLGGVVYKSLIKSVFKLPVRDANVAFKLIRKKYIDKIKLTMHSGALPVELVSKLVRAEAKLIEVKVSHFDRQFGKSQFFRWDKILKTIAEDWKLHRELSE